MDRNLLAGAALALLLNPSVAPALPLDVFQCVSTSQEPDCQIGNDQLIGDLVAGEPGIALLTISNAGPEDSVVARVFLEATLVDGILDASGEGTSFRWLRGPPVLPGAGRTFEVTAAAYADPAPPRNGIGPGQSATFTLDLVTDVALSQLALDLRVGVHVIAFRDGGSASFVTQPVPEPRSAALLGVALCALALAVRRPLPL